MEAKLDRLGEVVNGLVEVVDRLREVQAGHTATLARLDRRLSRVEGDLELFARCFLADGGCDQLGQFF